VKKQVTVIGVIKLFVHRNLQLMQTALREWKLKVIFSFLIFFLSQN